MKVYKLTDENHETFNMMKWGYGVEHRLPEKKNPQLCSPDLIHSYMNLGLGLLLNPIQGRFSPPVIWEADAEIVVEDWGKAGGFACRTLRIIPTPEWYSDTEQRMRICVQFAVLCAESVLPVFDEVCMGERRPRKAIEEAKKWIANPNEKGIKITSAIEAYRASLGDPYAARVAPYNNTHAATYDAVAAVDAAALASADAAFYTANSAANNAANAAANAATYAADAVATNKASTIYVNFARLADQAIELTLPAPKDGGLN